MITPRHVKIPITDLQCFQSDTVFSSIPIALIVDSFDIFHSGQGAQGHLGRISKQTLETVFGTKKEDEAIATVLRNGDLQAADAIDSQRFSSKNDSRGTNAGLKNGGR
jgi:Shwachman-Bodian-Diamond syndrome (SBDS) protein